MWIIDINEIYQEIEKDLDKKGLTKKKERKLDKQYIEKSLVFIDDERTFLLKELQSIKGVKVYKPAANYILMKLNDGMSANLLQERLLKEHHILIRDCSNYEGLEQSFVRVAIRTREENERLIEGLKSCNIEP